MTTTKNECGICKDELGDELVVEGPNGQKAHESCYRSLAPARPTATAPAGVRWS